MAPALIVALTGCEKKEASIVTASHKAQAVAFQNVGWPNLNGPDGANRSFETGLNWDWQNESPPELWRTQVGTGYGSPVAVPGHVIVLHRTSDQEIVESFHPETGQSQWAHQYPTSYVCKYDYSNGPYSTPVVVNQTVFVVGAQGQMRCLNLDDGSLIWKRMLHEDFQKPEQLFCVGASPLVIDARLIFNLGSVDEQAGIIGLDAATGETIWAKTDFGASYATPVAANIHGRQLAFVVTKEGLVALQPDDGTVLWDYPIKSNMAMTVNATSPIVVDNRVLLSIGPSAGCICLEILPDGSYREVWKHRRGLDSQFNSLMLWDGYLYGFCSLVKQGRLCCIDTTTGEQQWQHQSVLRRGQALIADNRIVVLGEAGHFATFELNPKKAQVLSLTDKAILDSPCYSSPALSKGLLYLRNEGTLLCLDLRRQ